VWTSEPVWTTWRRILTLQRLKLQPLNRAARSHSLYRLSYPGYFWPILTKTETCRQTLVELPHIELHPFESCRVAKADGETALVKQTRAFLHLSIQINRTVSYVFTHCFIFFKIFRQRTKGTNSQSENELCCVRLYLH
jgi:hypothetical protein